MKNVVLKVGNQFGFSGDSVESLTEGLIHQTYKVTNSAGKSIVLQQVNVNVFTDANLIVENYRLISECLRKQNGVIPTMLETPSGERLWIDDDHGSWRAFEYIDNSYTENIPATPETIYRAAECFGSFVRSLQSLNSKHLQPTIPSFHNLGFRYKQFHGGLERCTAARRMKSRELIRKIEARTHLVNFYKKLDTNNDFNVRPMHHDCKLGNILFNKITKQTICPIDLDTTMPGYFFSDVGDLIRSMVSNANESDPPESIKINRESYYAIIDGYRSGIKDTFTATEEKYIHHAGLLMIYMQAMRFLTDYLSNDIYYKISYPQQNFFRATNQLALLEKLEIFLKEEFNYPVS
jgi:Ser/Thr protein kinase RdoA (MazF antagonist)